MNVKSAKTVTRLNRKTSHVEIRIHDQLLLLYVMAFLANLAESRSFPSSETPATFQADANLSKQVRGRDPLVLIVCGHTDSVAAITKRLIIVSLPRFDWISN